MFLECSSTQHNKQIYFAGSVVYEPLNSQFVSWASHKSFQQFLKNLQKIAEEQRKKKAIEHV